MNCLLLPKALPLRHARDERVLVESGLQGRPGGSHVAPFTWGVARHGCSEEPRGRHIDGHFHGTSAGANESRLFLQMDMQRARAEGAAGGPAPRGNSGPARGRIPARNFSPIRANPLDMRSWGR